MYWRGWVCTPHPHQRGLILPSWWNVRQKAAVATLCTLWSHCFHAHFFILRFSYPSPLEVDLSMFILSAVAQCWGVQVPRFELGNWDRPCSKQAGALTTYLRLNIAPWYNLFCFFSVILSFLQALSLQPVFQNTNPSSTQVTDPCIRIRIQHFKKKLKTCRKKKVLKLFYLTFFQNKVRFYLYSIRLPGIQMNSGVHTVSSSANRVI